MADTKYQLRGNPVIANVPVVENLVYDELCREVLALHNERFKGVGRIEDATKYRDGQPISFSNVLRALSYNQILRERFPDMHYVLSPEEVVRYWDSIPERDETYADTDSVAVYPREGLNEDLRKKVLEILGKNRIEIPLAVSGLGVERADNEHGFTFTQTPYTQAREAHYLEHDGKLAYDTEKGLFASKQGVPVWTAQSGLRRFCRNRSDRLSAGGSDLLNSNSYGRVQILQDPKGRAEK